MARECAELEGLGVVAFDGKTLRASYDHFTDRKAVHLVSAFDIESALVLGHIEVDNKARAGVPTIDTPCLTTRQLTQRRLSFIWKKTPPLQRG